MANQIGGVVEMGVTRELRVLCAALSGTDFSGIDKRVALNAARLGEAEAEYESADKALRDAELVLRTGGRRRDLALAELRSAETTYGKSQDVLAVLIAMDSDSRVAALKCEVAGWKARVEFEFNGRNPAEEVERLLSRLCFHGDWESREDDGRFTAWFEMDMEP